MEPIEFLNYDRICDDLYYLNKHVVLRFNVGLASYRDGTRYFFHKEYEYQKERRNVVTIRRSYDYFLSLENIETKESIMILPKDYVKFRTAFQVALSWFQDKKYAKLYVTNKGKLMMTSPIPSCEINSLPVGKYLRLDPIIIDKGIANDDKIPGVAITMGDPNNYVNISVDSLSALTYIIDCVNMVQMAQTMIASIPIDHEINRKMMGGASRIDRIAYKVDNANKPAETSSIEGRFIGGKSKLEDL